MVVANGYTVTPHHRQNRRRERPGSRTRRTIARKSNIQYDCHEGLLDARDASVLLPSDKTKPSPLLRQNFDQSWQRWKARQAEEKDLAEMDRLQIEQEQLKLFGGDVDDDELYRMGILYKNDEDVSQDSEPNTVLCDVPAERSTPMFVIRHGKPSRSRRRAAWQSLSLHLSLSSLSEDVDIARLISPSVSHTPAIQHRNSISSTPTVDIPQSLPSTSAFGSTHLLDNTVPSPHSLDLTSGDWTFITTPHTNLQLSTPTSEPETWILLSDDS